MRPAAVRRRAVAALAGSLAAAALALAALGVAGGRGPLGARPAPDGARVAPPRAVRLTHVGGVVGLPSGPGQRYPLRLPPGWGLSGIPAPGWAELARRDGCSAAAVSAMHLPRTAPVGTRADQARSLLWEMVGREARPGATLTERVLLPGPPRRHAVVAADLHRMVAVLAQRPPADEGMGTLVLVVQGRPGPWPRCDRRRVRLGADELGRLVTGSAARALLRDAV